MIQIGENACKLSVTVDTVTLFFTVSKINKSFILFVLIITDFKGFALKNTSAFLFDKTKVIFIKV